MAIMLLQVSKPNPYQVPVSSTWYMMSKEFEPGVPTKEKRLLMFLNAFNAP